MPIISKERGYLFLMAPRTGCTAVGEAVLIPKLGGEYLPREDVLDEAGTLMVGNKHASLQELMNHGLIKREEAARLFKFTTVRNPFDSLVTLYVTMGTRYKRLLDDPTSFVRKKPGMSKGVQMASEYPFDEWVERKFHLNGLKGGLRWGLGTYPKPRHMYQAYLDGSDFVMRFERLQDDFNQVLKQLGVTTPIEIPRCNVTDGKDHYRAYYTSRARRVAERAFAPDLELFDYSF
jgi:hypothetical protein